MISNEAPRARANARPGRAAAWPYRRSTERLCHQLGSWSWVSHHLLKGLCFPTYKPKAAPLLTPKGPSGSEG